MTYRKNSDLPIEEEPEKEACKHEHTTTETERFWDEEEKKWRYFERIFCDDCGVTISTGLL